VCSWGTRSNARWREFCTGGCMGSLYQSRQERVSSLGGCREWGSLSRCLEVLRRVKAPATPGAQTVLGKRDASLPRPSPTDGPRPTDNLCLFAPHTQPPDPKLAHWGPLSTGLQYLSNCQCASACVQSNKFAHSNISSLLDQSAPSHVNRPLGRSTTWRGTTKQSGIPVTSPRLK
jgi:hypothetical protein